MHAVTVAAGHSSDIVTIQATEHRVQLMYAHSVSCSRVQLRHSDYSSSYAQTAADVCMHSQLQQAICKQLSIQATTHKFQLMHACSHRCSRPQLSHCTNVQASGHQLQVQLGQTKSMQKSTVQPVAGAAGYSWSTLRSMFQRSAMLPRTTWSLSQKMTLRRFRGNSTSRNRIL